MSNNLNLGTSIVKLQLMIDLQSDVNDKTFFGRCVLSAIEEKKPASEIIRFLLSHFVECPEMLERVIGQRCFNTLRRIKELN